VAVVVALTLVQLLVSAPEVAVGVAQLFDGFKRQLFPVLSQLL
jgi:hypothetical protein